MKIKERIMKKNENKINKMNSKKLKNIEKRE